MKSQVIEYSKPTEGLSFIVFSFKFYKFNDVFYVGCMYSTLNLFCSVSFGFVLIIKLIE